MKLKLLTILLTASLASTALAAAPNKLKLFKPGLVGSTPSTNNQGNSPLGNLTADTTADFGAVTINGNASRSFTFTNTGEVAMTDLRAVLTGADLTLVSSNCGTPTTPVSLQAHSSCSMLVTWSPLSIGSLSSVSLAVKSGETNIMASIAFSGTAVY